MSPPEPGILRLCRHSNHPLLGLLSLEVRAPRGSASGQPLLPRQIAWFYPVLLLVAASIDFLVGWGLQRIPREKTRPRLALVSVSVILNVGLLAATKFIPVAPRRALPLGLSPQFVLLLFPVNDLHD